MRSQHAAPAVGLGGVGVLLAALHVLVGLDAWGWAAGLGGGVVMSLCLRGGMRRLGSPHLGPADVVTLVRAVLTCGVAALVTDSLVGSPAGPELVALATVALALDAVDGRVARWTRSTTPFGSRFDGEVDAFLITVLAVHVASGFGWWVVAMGAVRYVFGAAGWWRPWMRGELLPFRYWRKVVTASVGTVLVTVTADVLPRLVSLLLLLGAAALLAETFGRDVAWLWRRRPARTAAPAEPTETEPETLDGPVAAAPRRSRLPMGSAVGLLVVWVVLVAPNQTYLLGPSAFLRIPVEGLVLVGLALALPDRARRVMAVPVGLVLFAVTLLKLLDMGFFAAFDRPFDLANDRGYLGPAIAILSDSVGRAAAVAAVAVIAVLLVVLAIGLPVAVGRGTALLARHRRGSVRALAALTVVYATSAALGLQVTAGVPLASLSAGRLAVDHARDLARNAEAQRQFDAAVRTDRFRTTPGGNLLNGLRGKDVLVVFVESYGRVALEGPPEARRLRAMLDAETRRLAAKGFSSSSAYLTSSTFGGLSWLAHGTLQSGLWVDSQRRYDELLSGQRLTLSRAFARAGWRTAAFLPSAGDPWPEGKRFYRLDKVYGRWDVGYRGPRFGFSKMPDQFALEAVGRLELRRSGGRPLMAEIDLASSHEPWAKVPRMVPWDALGDGSVFEQMADEVEIPVRELWADTDDVKAAYARSVRYSLRAVFSFLQRHGDEDTVLVVLGDHQPGTVVTGHRASRDVPVTLIAGDPAVSERITGWGWQPGLRPDGRAPVWRMDSFRDRFFDAFTRGTVRRPPAPGPAARPPAAPRAEPSPPGSDR
ncbi:MAG TPA: CDP-alcohol phosphatidyltransferase family protein [Nocardioidaceae bacterium]|nr:CDP-alcohol phosphatidyltransferase family protein [Nocardioidaceae bacterium]